MGRRAVGPEKGSRLSPGKPLGPTHAGRLDSYSSRTDGGFVATTMSAAPSPAYPVPSAPPMLMPLAAVGAEERRQTPREYDRKSLKEIREAASDWGGAVRSSGERRPRRAPPNTGDDPRCSTSFL